MMKPLFVTALFLTSWCISSASLANQEAVDKFVQSFMSDYEMNARQDIIELCEAKWNDDFVMQKHCVDEQSQARTYAQNFDTMKSLENTKIWAKCAQDWTDENDLIDWVMMSHCLDAQSVARGEMKSLKKGK